MDAGMLEIYQYVPQAMLEGVDLSQAGLDTFASYLAMARYLEEVQANMIADALSRLFPD